MISTQVVTELHGELRGRVIAPGDAGYDDARTVAYGGEELRPVAIARVADAIDVSLVIRFARETGLELAVRGGGHSFARHGVTDGGIVLDLRDMRSLAIDADRTAWAETGLTTGEYTAAAATCHLATGFGDTASVGIGGITLGGGVGFLVRKHGLTVDNLLAAEVVTADGEILLTDAESHPDLFWAIRGGGGNFGVATQLQFQLHELDGIVGGLLVLPATPDVIAGFIAEAEAAPEELSAIVNVMPAPPMPFLPREHHGKPVVMATMAFAGPPDAGQRAVAPFRSLARPITDLLRPMPYPELFPPEQGAPQAMAAAHTAFLDGVDRTAAETMLEHLDRADARMAVAQLRVLGGAVARVPEDATAYAHRDRRVMVNLAALYGDAGERSLHEGWVASFAAALDAGAGAYVNFLADEGKARVREAYPGRTWERLTRIKARYDPTNLFRLNQNIPPATRTAAMSLGASGGQRSSRQHDAPAPPARTGESMGQPVVHFEILGKNADRTQGYYSELFGWSVEPLGFDNPTQYGIVQRDGNTNGDGIGIGGGVGQAPDGYDGHVTFYVEVPDVEAALSNAESLGGTRTMGPDQVPGGPVIGLFRDPDGNTVGVVEGG